MIIPKKSATILVRVVAYSLLALALWFKFRVSELYQLRILSLFVFLGVLVLNQNVVRLLWNRRRLPALQRSVLVARAGKMWVLVAGLLAVLFSDIAMVRGLVRIADGKGLSQDAFGAVYLPAFLGTLFVYGGAYELRITPDTIGYVAFFGGCRLLSREEIDHARIRSGWYSYWDRFRPTHRLEVFPCAGAERDPIIVNLKVFRKTELQQVFEWLGEKLQNA